MKRIKKNNRNKAILGALAMGAFSGIGEIIKGIINKNTIKEQNALKTLNENSQAIMMQQNNRDEVINNNIIDELALSKTNNINTLNSAMCFGGKRRMKKAGGTISANVKGLDRYI